MKEVLKRVLKTLLVFLISTIVIYSVLVIHNFIKWANENQLSIMHNNDSIDDVNPEKIKEIGDYVGLVKDAMEESINQPREEGQHVLAEYYDPLGFAVWTYMDKGIQNIFDTMTLSMALLTGTGIAIAYFVITSKKLNTILKIFIGYVAVVLVVPHIYMYTWTYRFWGLFIAYKDMPIFFYILFTLVFITIYVINYLTGKKMTKDLNEVIANNKKDK